MMLGKALFLPNVSADPPHPTPVRCWAQSSWVCCQSRGSSPGIVRFNITYTVRINSASLKKGFGNDFLLSPQVPSPCLSHYFSLYLAGDLDAKYQGSHTEKKAILSQNKPHSIHNNLIPKKFII